MMGMMPSNCCATSAATLLMTLALGYIVCYLANKEKKALKSVGFAIGILIIIASSSLMLEKIIWRVKTCGRISHKMMMPPAPVQMPMAPRK